MNKTNIEWCDLTWNPVIGCDHGCPYCWAKRFNDRFGFIADFKNPRIIPLRLMDPIFEQKPKRIFVVSMGDLFCKSVPDRWIKDVIDVAEICTRHTFMFLTKNPERYNDFYFPENCELGTSIDYKHNAARLEPLKRYNNTTVTKFVSVEPILSDFEGVDFSFLDKVIVGAQTGAKAVKPQTEWIKSIKHDLILFKNNIRPYLDLPPVKKF